MLCFTRPAVIKCRSTDFIIEKTVALTSFFSPLIKQTQVDDQTFAAAAMGWAHHIQAFLTLFAFFILMSFGSHHISQNRPVGCCMGTFCVL